MSTPGDLAWLRAAIFHELETGPLSLPSGHPEAHWVHWLGLRTREGEAPDLRAQGSFDFMAADCHAEGILPEVVYSGLVQTWWHPGQQDWVARTRSEILTCYRSSERESESGWTLTLEVLRRINALRLQELTPEELLDACRPYCGRAWSLEEQPPMEAWVLLHLEQFQRLQDVAACLRPFLENPSRTAGLPAEEVTALLHSPAAPEHVRAWLNVPTGLDWPDAVALLGAARVERWLSS